MNYMNNRTIHRCLCACIFLTTLFSACSKSDGGGTTPNLCDGVNITVSATTTSATFCLDNGAITVTASGSTDLNYSLNGRTFQSSNIFSGLAKGTYTVTVTDDTGEKIAIFQGMVYRKTPRR